MAINYLNLQAGTIKLLQENIGEVCKRLAQAKISWMRPPERNTGNKSKNRQRGLHQAKKLL